MKRKVFDLICMGGASVDLYSEQLGVCLEHASHFTKYVGGCAANIAIGGRRLGLEVAMLSRLGEEAMGNFVRKTLENEGVDTQLVLSDTQRLTGLTLLSTRGAESFPLLYYRENCADMAISSEDYRDAQLASAAAILVTGTQFSQKSAADNCLKLVQRAKNQGLKIILDVDFQPVLWGGAFHAQGKGWKAQRKLVAERMGPLLAYCDLIVGTEEELQVISGKMGTAEAVEYLQEECTACIVEKRGPGGCAVHSKGEASREFLGESVQVLNVLGAGDAFMAGFLRGWLRGESMEICCRWANYCGAIVATRHGCSPETPYWEELCSALEEPRKISDGRLLRVHRSMERRDRDERPFCLLAFDHRQQMLSYSEDLSQIRRFKGLIYDALKEVQSQAPTCRLGLIVDEQLGGEVLARAETDGVFCASPIEEAQSFPVRFLHGQEASLILRHWPKERAVKVLIRISPQHKGEDEECQWQRLVQLQQACEVGGHQLLIEMVVPASVPDAFIWVHQAVQRACSEGVEPTWWKLPPYAAPEMWRGIQDTIRRRTPHCRGILVLGQGEAWNSLAEKLPMLSQQELIRGFAVGRSIWRQAAEAWFAGRMSDEAVVELVAQRYRDLITAFCQPAAAGIS